MRVRVGDSTGKDDVDVEADNVDFSRFVTVLFYFGHCSLSISVERQTPYFVSVYSPLRSPFLSYTMWNNPPGNWQRSSQLDSLITRATTAVQPENNYALHIEIAEYINKKKANTYISFS
jgi:hypothetical protein